MNLHFSTDPLKEKIVELRHLAYENYYKDKVLLSGLDWNSIDEKSTHLSLSIDSQMVCYLRISVFSDIHQFLKTTQIPLITPDPDTPYVLLSRGATHPNFNSLGFHSILRRCALEICLNSGLYNIYGSLESRSARLDQLLSLGYKIVNRASTWPQSYIKNTGDVVLIQLKGKNRVKAASQKIGTEHKLISPCILQKIYPKNYI